MDNSLYREDRKLQKFFHRYAQKRLPEHAKSRLRSFGQMQKNRNMIMEIYQNPEIEQYRGQPTRKRSLRLDITNTDPHEQLSRNKKAKYIHTNQKTTYGEEIYPIFQDPDGEIYKKWQEEHQKQAEELHSEHIYPYSRPGDPNLQIAPYKGQRRMGYHIQQFLDPDPTTAAQKEKKNWP